MDITLLYKEFGRRLKDARKTAKLTQEILAAQVGLSRTSITNIERGRQHIQIHTMFLLCDAIGIHPSKLLKNMRLTPDNELDTLHSEKSSLSTEGKAWVEKIISTKNDKESGQ
jgi:transcriptional regulator with XRE-family HTH domain